MVIVIFFRSFTGPWPARAKIELGENSELALRWEAMYEVCTNDTGCVDEKRALKREREREREKQRGLDGA